MLTNIATSMTSSVKPTAVSFDAYCQYCFCIFQIHGLPSVCPRIYGILVDNHHHTLPTALCRSCWNVYHDSHERNTLLPIVYQRFSRSGSSASGKASCKEWFFEKIALNTVPYLCVIVRCYCSLLICNCFVTIPFILHQTLANFGLEKRLVPNDCSCGNYAR